MSCKLWITKGLPLLEGGLEASEAEAYRRHLAGCPACGAEVAKSQAVIDTLRTLPEPELAPAAAAALDRAVLARVRASGLIAQTVTAQAPVALRSPSPWVGKVAPDPARVAAARAIALRSRLAGRPLFAGERPALEPSFLLMAFGITIAAMATTVFFGEWMVRSVGERIVAAMSALGGSGAWLSARVSEAMVAMVAILRIVRGVIENAAPWFDAVRELAQARSAELLMASAAVAVLVGVGAVLLRRDAHRDFRRDLRGIR
jgi:hypothetical protein